MSKFKVGVLDGKQDALVGSSAAIRRLYIECLTLCARKLVIKTLFFLTCMEVNIYIAIPPNPPTYCNVKGFKDCSSNGSCSPMSSI